MTQEEEIDEIEKFRSNFIFMTPNQTCRMLSKKLDDVHGNEYVSMADYFFIVDYINKEPVLKMYGAISDITKRTFRINKTADLSFLDKYKTDNTHILLQCDKVKPKLSADGYQAIYAIGRTWLAYTYFAKGSKYRRMCINSKIFGKHKEIGSREHNIEMLLY